MKPTFAEYVRFVLKSARSALMTLLVFGVQPAPAASLYPFAIDQDHLSGVVDFSDLSDGPIRDADRLVVCGSRLCRAGQRNSQGQLSPVRLFGVTLAYAAVFPTADEADMLIARLRRLGVNLVRLHAFDSVPDSAPANAQSVLLDGPFPTFNPESLRRMQQFIAKLGKAGIYVDLNLHVAYRFRPAIDKVAQAGAGDDFMPDGSKPLYIFDDRMIALQTEYTKGLLDALGPSAKNTVAIVEISNENSLVYEWALDRLDRDVRGFYRTELLQKWIAWQIRTGSGSDVITDLPGRKDSVSSEVKDRFVSFLTAQDKSYLDHMRGVVKSVNPDVLVVGTQMEYGGMRNLASNSAMDIMDAHVYIDHYGFLGKFFDWKTWYIHDVSGFDNGLADLQNVAFYRTPGKPYIVSEYNQPWPNRQAAEIIPEMAGLASLQDWSAIVFYDYSNTRDDFHVTTPREFVLDADFTKLPTVGPMAWMYRTFDVKPASASLDVRVPDDASLASIREGVIDQSARFLAHSLAGDTDAAFSKRVGVSLESVPGNANAAIDNVQDGGNPGVIFDTAARHAVFDSRSLIGVVGRLKPGVETELGGFQMKLAPDARGFVTFLAMSRDHAPVEQSKHMLWVLPGYTLGSKPGVNPPEPESLVDVDVGVLRKVKDLAKAQGEVRRVHFPDPPQTQGYGVLAAHAPVWMERVECVVMLPHAYSKVQVYPLDGRGRRLAPLPAKDAYLHDHMLTVHLQGDGQALSPWYELTFE